MTPGGGKVLAIVCLLSMLTGCGGSARRAVGPCVLVQGKVTLAGKPLVGGTVTFVPTEEGDRPRPEGVIDAQGNYAVKTEGRDGAPVGRYRVAVTTGGEDKTQEAKFDSRYSSWDKTPLTVEVTESARPGAYDLKLEPIKR